MPERNELTISRAAGYAAGAAVLAHCGALASGFVFDDVPYYAESNYLQSLSGVLGVFGDGYWESGELSWRPVAVALQVVQRVIAGASPLAHACSVLLHACVAALLVRWLCDLKLAPAAAAAGGVLFAVHPALAETVIQVSFAEDLWAALFLLLSCRIIAWGPGGWGRAAAAAGLALLAMGSKESALVFPACWLLTAWSNRAAWDTGRTPTVVLGAAALALFVLLRFGLYANPAPSGVGGLPSLVSGDLWILGRYGLLLAFPWNLCADYSVPHPVPAGGLALGLALPVVLALLAWRRRETLPGAVWFAVALLPVMNLVPLSTPMAERFLYLPALGLAWAVAALWDRLETPQRAAGIWVLGLLVVAGTVRTQVRARDYDSAERLWTATLRVNPRSLRGLQNLAGVRLKQGRVKEAVDLDRERLRLYPDQPDGRFSLALSLRQWAVEAGPGTTAFKSRLVEAEKLLRAELDRWPQQWKARVLLADLQIAKGRPLDALEQLAMVPEPHHGSVHFLQTRITALLKMGRKREARGVLERALQRHPGHPGLLAMARAIGP